MFGFSMDLKGFELYLRQQNLAESTIKTYLICLNVVRKAVNSFNDFEINKFLLKKISLINKGEISSSGVNKYIKAIKKYYDFVNLKPPENIKKLRENPEPRTIFTSEEIEKIIEVDSPPDKYGMYFELLAFTGARPHEIAEMTQSMLYLDRQVFYAIHTKTRESRKIAFPLKVQRSLRKYLPTLKGELLFPASRDPSKPISNAVVNKELRRRKKITGITKNATANSFRHSYIDSQARAKNPLSHIQEQVGHKDANRTKSYTHPNEEDLVILADNDPRLSDYKSSNEAAQEVLDANRDYKQKFSTQLKIGIVETPGNITIQIKYDE